MGRERIINLGLEALLDSEDVAELFGKTSRTIRNMHSRGDLPSVDLPGTRGLRFRAAVIRALLEPNTDDGDSSL